MKITGQPMVNKGMKPARIAQKTVRMAKPKNMAVESKDTMKVSKPKKMKMKGFK